VVFSADYSMNRLERGDKPIITLVNVSPTVDGKFNGEPVKDVYTHAKIPAVGPAIINSVLLGEDYDGVTTIDPRFNPDGKFSSWDMERLYRSDVVAATSMTRNRTATLDLFRDLKEFDPEITTIAGGFSPSFEHEKWLQENSADFVVIKEGSVSIVELLEAIRNSGPLESIKGIAYKKDGKIIETEKRDLLTEAELAEIPIPFFPERILKNCTTHAIVGSHGCYGNCEFCAVTAFNEGKYRKESDEKVIKQIRNAPRGKGVFIVDDNLAPLGRKEDAKTTMRSIIEAGLNDRNYFVQLDTVTVSKDPEVIGLLKKMGVLGVFLGVESMNEATLRLMKKPATVKQNEQAIRIFRNNGIYVHAMTIAGSDGETYESIQATNEWLMKAGVNSIQLFAEIPVPGSRLAERKSVLLRVEENTNRMDGQHVVAVPPEGMTCSGLQEKIIREYERFYAKGRTLESLRPLLLFPKDPKRALRVAAMSFAVRIYGRKQIAAITNNENAREWQKYLKRVDEKIAKTKEVEQGLAKEGILFDSSSFRDQMLKSA
jgi:radical SAM superfamily enzyme YgiQ (UPF0313 family)